MSCCEKLSRLAKGREARRDLLFFRRRDSLLSLFSFPSFSLNFKPQTLFELPSMTSPRNENPFKKLVRSLSRSSPRTERPSNSRQRSTSGAITIPNSNKENGGISPSLAAFSTSPPPGEFLPLLLFPFLFLVECGGRRIENCKLPQFR